MKIALKLLLLLALLPANQINAQSQPVNDPLLDKMIGKWVLHGTIAGQETTHDVTVNWVLGQQYIEINETSREKDAGGRPQYEAIVFITWEQDKNQYSCLWLDNTGNGGLSGQAVGHAERSSNILKFLFRIPGNDDFQTTFVYNPQSDTWQWLMDSLGKEKTEVFARLTMTRTGSTQLLPVK